jgi:hypothetical protein
MYVLEEEGLGSGDWSVADFAGCHDALPGTLSWSFRERLGERVGSDHCHFQ